MDIQKLDELSRKVADSLFAQFPEWRKLARVQPGADGTDYLEMEIGAPPESGVDHGLTITTENGEVTIGFDYYHGHFFGQVGDGVRVGADYAIHLVSEIVNERIPVISWWQDGALVAFSTIESGKALMDDSLVGPYDKIRVRSWKGNLNADRIA